MFSFLTTAYRTEDVLERMISSVLAQTMTDWELVIVDNGWSDAIADVVRPHLSDRRVTFVRQENRGAAGGTMAAAAEARGRFLVPLNSDDALEPQFCRRMADLVEQTPDVAAVTCDAYLFVDPGEQRMVRTYLRNPAARRRSDPAKRLSVADVIDGPCPYYSAAIRKDVWESLGGLASDTPMVDDLAFWLRALAADHDVRMIPDVLARFRVETDSVSRPAEAARAEEFEVQRERALIRAVETSGDADAQAALDRVLRKLRYVQSLRRARLAFRAGDVEDARRHVGVAFGQQRTARSAGLLLSLRLAPGVLRRMHPAKQKVQARVDAVRRLGWRQLLRSGRDARGTRDSGTP
ncbi:glycosyltransferase [Actinomycetospora aeridis]|uniref:Glycosyltransferase n=1 Tax=Actinomycetospora aeridis TaxID=3129231 RepID=A0ABU8N6S5_9PSEU